MREAERCFRQAIKFRPHDYSAYFGLGQLFEKQGNTDAAIEAYEKSLEGNANAALAHYCLGTLYAQKQDRRALRHLTEAVRLMPDSGQAHNNLAVLYASMEPAQLGLARQYARKALLLGYGVDQGFQKQINLSEEDSR